MYGLRVKTSPPCYSRGRHWWPRCVYDNPQMVPYGNRESPNGILSASHFPYGDPHMETVNPNANVFSFGDFFLNPQMVMDTVWKRVSDWTVPIWKRGDGESPNGFCFLPPHFHTGSHHVKWVLYFWQSIESCSVPAY